MSAWLCIISQPRGYAIWPRSSPLGIFQYIPPEALYLRNIFLSQRRVWCPAQACRNTKYMRRFSIERVTWCLFSCQHPSLRPARFARVNRSNDKVLLNLCIPTQRIFLVWTVNPRLAMSLVCLTSNNCEGSFKDEAEFSLSFCWQQRLTTDLFKRKF